MSKKFIWFGFTFVIVLSLSIYAYHLSETCPPKDPKIKTIVPFVPCSDGETLSPDELSGLTFD